MKHGLKQPSLRVEHFESSFTSRHSARVDATDKEDVMYLIGLLNLKSPEDVFSIIEHYYPRQRIKPATQFFVEELFQDADASRVEGDNSEGSR